MSVGVRELYIGVAIRWEKIVQKWVAWRIYFRTAYQ